MTSARGARIIAEAIALLTRERELLLAGAFVELASVAQTRSDRIERLAALDNAAALALATELEALRAAARRNGALLKAAMEGAAAGRRRLAALRDGQNRLASYDASGAPVDHVTPAAIAGRRA